MRALVLLKINAAETQDATRLLRRLSAVEEACMTFGRYDAAAVLTAKSLEEMRSILLSQILPIPGVTDALTCLIAEEEDAGQPIPPRQFLRTTV